MTEPAVRETTGPGSSAMTRPRWAVVTAVLAVVVLALLAAGLSVLRPGAGDAAADTFVTRSGTTLRVGDTPFRFVGVNLYDAAASDIYSCNPGTRLDDAGLDAAMQQVRDLGGTVVRFWAFQTYTRGGTDFSGVDRVIDAARAHGLRVLPVLEDGPGNCSTGVRTVHLSQTDGGRWYDDGWREPLGEALVSYEDYVQAVARRYRDEPTIIGWSLVNEAETPQRDEDGQSVLVDFARDVSALVRAADPRHLITLGTQSNGAPGTSGSDFAAIYGLPDLDLTEVHDWAYYGSDLEAMPGAGPDGELPTEEECRSSQAQIACSFVLARALGKPIVVGEAGMRARDRVARERRAGLMREKIRAAFDAGSSGYLIWQLNRENTDGYALVTGSNDPLIGVLRDASRRWSSGR